MGRVERWACALATLALTGMPLRVAAQDGAMAGGGTEFTCRATRLDAPLRLDLDSEPTGSPTGTTCVIHAGTAESCAQQLAACVTLWGRAHATVDAATPAMVRLDPAVDIASECEGMPGSFAPSTTPGTEVPPHVDPPLSPYPYLLWEVGVAGSQIVDAANHLVGGAGGVSGRVGLTFSSVVSASLGGFATFGGAAWSPQPSVGLAASLDLELYALRGRAEHAALGAIDLSVLISAGVWHPSVTNCNAIGPFSPTCHVQAAWRLGLRLMPTGGASPEGGEAGFQIGLDTWVGYAPEIGQWSVSPMIVVGFGAH